MSKEEHMNEEALIDGGSSPLAYIHVKTLDERIEFSCESFGTLLTKPLITDNGQTVGERNRAWLHAKLDAWLDKTWEKNT
jgi:hypothetical protein